MEIIELSKTEILALADMATKAFADDRSFRIARNGTGISFKIGGGMWTAPMGDTE